MREYCFLSILAKYVPTKIHRLPTVEKLDFSRPVSFATSSRFGEKYVELILLWAVFPVPIAALGL